MDFDYHILKIWTIIHSEYWISWNLTLKGQSKEIFTSDFFNDGLLSSPLIGYLKTFRIWLRIRWDIRGFCWLSAVIYSGELILLVLFTTESCNSPHHFGGESPFVSIICINSRLSFNTESRYSRYCLLRRVTTPRHIYSWESLLTAEFFSKTLNPRPLKEQWTKKMDYPCRVLLTKSISKE
jgi:hypothetical protein